MKLDQKHTAYFFGLETSLHKSEIRRSPEAVAALLADGFIEFGSSGKIWDKSSIVENMRKEEPPGQIIVEDFVARELTLDVVLVTYISRTSTANQFTLRSSIWKNIATKWQMVFHQGTPSFQADAQ